MLRVGPYGDGFGSGPGTLSLAALEAAPHGIDLGALKPRLPEVLRTTSGKVELAPESLVADVDRLHDGSAPGRRKPAHPMGRCDYRPARPALEQLVDAQPDAAGQGQGSLHRWVHPEDAARLGLSDGEPAVVSAHAGTIEVPVQITEDVMPGVVSIPHGWGHGQPGTEMAVAGAHPGVNSNVLADDQELEPLTGTAILNGIPVTLVPAAVPA